MAVEKFEFDKGMTGKIEHDPDPINWRQDEAPGDRLGTMAYWHSRYTLGDEQPGGLPEEYWAKVQEENKGEDVVMLPLYLYDHSGMAISTQPFSCPWDSGQVGFIWITVADARKILGDQVTTQQIERALEAEVNDYNLYITGQVYGYILEIGEQEVDSCWGYYGLKDAQEALKQAADCFLENANQEIITQAIEEIGNNLNNIW